MVVLRLKRLLPRRCWSGSRRESQQCSQRISIKARRACACVVWNASKQEALVQRRLHLQREMAEEVERQTDFNDGPGVQLLQRARATMQVQRQKWLT